MRQRGSGEQVEGVRAVSIPGQNLQIGHIPDTTPEQADAARTYLATVAHDTDDLRLLLDALGLA